MKSLLSKPSRPCLLLVNGLSLAILAACGGSDGAASTTGNAASARKTIAAVTATADAATRAPEESPRVIRVEQLRATRVDRTRYDYVFALHIRGTAENIENGEFVASTTGLGSELLDRSARIAKVDAGRFYRLDDTITIRHDRQYPFDFGKLTFTFTGELASSSTAGAGPRIGPVQFYVLGGRAGHEGYFPTAGDNPVAGSTVQLRAAIFGSLAEARFTVLDAGGAEISGGSLSHPWSGLSDNVAELNVPAVPFRLKVVATGTDGFTTGWTSDVYTPQTLDASFEPDNGAFHYGAKVTGNIRLAPSAAGGSRNVNLVLPDGFTADKTAWTVSFSDGKAVKLPVAIQTPASGKSPQFFEVSVSTRDPGNAVAPSYTHVQLFAR